jgi:hypothetical protein
MDAATTLGIAVAVAAGVLISGRLQKKKNQQMATAIEPALRERGPLTLLELVEAVGLKGFSARGKVAMSLNDLAAQGKVEIVPAPEGTPQLQKVNFIKYRLRG